MQFFSNLNLWPQAVLQPLELRCCIVSILKVTIIVKGLAEVLRSETLSWKIFSYNLVLLNSKWLKLSAEPEKIQIKVTPSPFEDFQEMPNPTSTVDTLGNEDGKQKEKPPRSDSSG